MSVSSLQETTVLEIIERADATSIARYKKAIEGRETVLIHQSWRMAMVATVEELRSNPVFDKHRALVDTLHLSKHGHQLRFVDATLTYCFWYGSNHGREVRMMIGANRHAEGPLVELNARRFTCSGDPRAFPSNVIAFAYALLTVDVENMLNVNNKKLQK